jgi:iron-sulfur cluster repair protein YtfE (RIC family)
MATARKTTATKTVTRKAAAKPAGSGSSGPDAIALLRADHKRVAALYAQYEATRSSAKKKALVTTICQELSIHAQVEEEIFYPAVKAALKDKELVPEATVEHATLKELIAQVKDKEPDGEMFDAKIKVMSEYTKHHVKEEQTEMFPKAQKTKLDMQALGAQIAARKEELLANPALLEKPPVPASPAMTAA